MAGLCILFFIIGLFCGLIVKGPRRPKITRIKESATQYILELDGYQWYRNKPMSKRTKSTRHNAKKENK